MENNPVNNDKIDLFRTSVLGLLFAGGLGSLVLTIQAGRNNKSIVLVLLFAIWVLSPFAGLLVANLTSKLWQRTPRITLYYLTVFLTLGSLVCYSGVLNPLKMKNAAIFLIVPLLSWMVMLVTYLFTKFGKMHSNQG